MPDPQAYWPGEVFVPENYIVLLSFVACCCLLAAAAVWWRSRSLVRLREAPKWWLAAALISLLCTAPSVYAIYQRHTGRWAGLKAFLQFREAALRRFIRTQTQLYRGGARPMAALSEPQPP